MRVVGAVGAITRLFSLAYLLPLLTALLYDGPGGAHGVLVFAAVGGASFVLGSAMRFAARNVEGELRDRDAYLTVGLGWLWLCLLGMLPFLLMGALTSPIDAFFETMSGLTTTGATVMTSLETTPRSLIMWRAVLQFLGGMGIIVLSVAIISRLTQGGIQMLQAEAPGPSVTRIAPRLAQTARILWGVYLTMTAVLFVLLCIVLWQHGFGVKQTVFEAVVHTFTTISTGGFSSHDASIAYFDDWLLEVLLIVFMLVSGTNYTLHYHLFRGQGVRLWRDPEWRFFMATYLVASVVLAGVLWQDGGGLLGGLRAASFTVASLITSTGFGTSDFDAWPEVAKAMLLLLMVTGATAGSTGGGLKHIRVLLIAKIIRRHLRLMLHRRAVVPVRLGHRVIEGPALMAVVAFFVAFIGVWALGTLFLLFTDSHFPSAIDAASASISALSNMGPGLGVVGPTHTYAALDGASKLMLSFEMWFGRLEIFTALLVFTPETWRH